MSESPKLQRAADEAFDSLIDAVTVTIFEVTIRGLMADSGVRGDAATGKAIFSEIGLQGFRKFTAELTAAKRENEDPDLATRLLERYIEFALEHKGYFRVMFRSEGEAIAAGALLGGY
jgi:hypothetical protein